MRVHLRQRRQKNGKISLYLEIYKGYLKTNNKTKAIRDYEYLNLYLYNKPSGFIQKKHNKETLQLAKTIKAQKEIDIQNGKYGFSSKSKQNSDFLKYFQKLTNDRLQSKGNYGNWNSVLKHLKGFTSNRIIFKDIDEKFCEGFKEYLVNTALKKNGEKLSTSSISSYYNKFKASLKKAIEDKIITYNPSINIKLPKIIENKRQYLTLEELQSLYKTECRYPVLKRAFLFSCLTGLRKGDVQDLKWNDLHTTEDGVKITHHQEKTESLEYLDINHQAVELIGNREGDDDLVFKGLKFSTYVNTALMLWILKAGITKHITFHCARHTYATLLFNYGVDLFTVSKLLGHKSIKNTQIYAKIIDKTKREAVNKLPQIKI